MSQLTTTIEKQGAWLSNAIDILAEHAPAEVLPALYNLDTIQNYLVLSIEKLKKEILSTLNSKMYWSETGDLDVVNDHFISCLFGFETGYVKFIKDLKKDKFSVSQLMKMKALLNNGQNL